MDIHATDRQRQDNLHPRLGRLASHGVGRQNHREGLLELGWQATERAYHVSAAGITGKISWSLRKSMEHGHEDRSIWLESYLEEAEGLKEQDTYATISAKDYANKYSDIQIIPSMSV
jgi:hypothetical protein